MLLESRVTLVRVPTPGPFLVMHPSLPNQCFFSVLLLSFPLKVKNTLIYIKMCVPVHHANAVLQTRSCASETIKNLNEHKT